MKKLFIPCAIAVLAITFTSCTSIHYETMRSGDSIQISQLPVKDYDIIAPIKLTTKITEKESIFKFSNSKQGSEIIYQLLLDQAYNLGGNEVVNVRISKKQDADIKFNGIFGKEVTYTYTATALAIKISNQNVNSDVQVGPAAVSPITSDSSNSSSTTNGGGIFGPFSNLLK